MPSNDEHFETKELTALRKGMHSFQAAGYSFLKVTTIENGQQKVVSYKVPIKSQGVSELIEQLRAKEPRPPSIRQLVKPDDDVGRQMRLTRNQWVLMPDFTDPQYMQDVSKRETDAIYQIVAVGLNLKLEDERGNIVDDNDNKIAILKSMGFSMQHFQQLAGDIRQLTEWAEGERINFTDRPSAAMPMM